MRTTVYIVQEGIDYEGNNDVVAFTTREEAEEFVKQVEFMESMGVDGFELPYVRGYHDYINIQEITVFGTAAQAIEFDKQERQDEIEECRAIQEKAAQEERINNSPFKVLTKLKQEK